MASSSSFLIKSHTIESQHIREYPHATAHSQEEPLLLAVKQYIPLSNLSPSPGDISIIAAHANGFPKELYEPLWEDLLHLLGQRGIKIRGIWIADVTHQGQSGILNEANLGNDRSLLDRPHPRPPPPNQHFPLFPPPPLIGLGHSFGANIIVNLSLLHPRLFTSLLLLDPVLSRFQSKGPAYGFAPMKASAFRRDLWPSLSAAKSAFESNPFYKTWDKRVFNKWLEHGLRPTPTRIYPDAPEGSVTLLTTKHMESFTYYRPIRQKLAQDGKSHELDWELIPDADEVVKQNPDFPFYRPEGGPATADKLPNVRPGCIWIFGGESNVNPADVRQEKLDLTGVGPGGSGGVKKGRVKAVTIEGFGHLVPMERTTEVAGYAADFLVEDLKYWKKEQQEFEEHWKKKRDEEKWVLSEEFEGWMGGRPVRKAKKDGEGPKGKL
ncbi:Alpha/beta hydrolase family-domain-containing protein [Apiosordaria backusii]|uniref:Alpha/beta hydrolase family-domain-containing protein n=1 Tax=Apiosordaria backusii TaxID=314023 RepID=A0AA40K1Q0_9PEZI|nr:Alpha/beta hydrolase family-domain-containing protein [Apiosordaria backusii]